MPNTKVPSSPIFNPLTFPDLIELRAYTIAKLLVSKIIVLTIPSVTSWV